MTPDSAFLQPLGTNGRSCFTCHQPQDGWSVSAAGARARFAASGGADPLFRLVDGATCPTAPVGTDEQRQQAFRLLTDKGLFRIGLPLPQPPALQFKIAALHDPYHCSSNPATGLTSQTSGILSVYRRPLAATNLGFLSTIMWDGREPDLTSQAVDATLGHAQANAAPTTVQQDQMVAFESGIFTAQAADRISARMAPRAGRCRCPSRSRNSSSE
jgi:cytochrome c peroxidase